MSAHLCPVCRYPELAEPPRTDAGPSYEVCPSCGFEFGVTDDDLGIPESEWRRRWLAEGARWQSSSPAPPGWDGAAQALG